LNNVNYLVDNAIQAGYNPQSGVIPPFYYQGPRMASHPGYSSTIPNPNDELLRKMADMMENQFGIKKNNTFTYKHPYPEWYNQVSLPSNYRVSYFTKFTRQDNTSTIEHISRYLAQLGDISNQEIFRVRFFSLSLSGPAFTWYTSLVNGSVTGWEDLGKKFHAYFFTGIGEKKLTDLTMMRQRNNESGLEYLQRFRHTRNMCFTLTLPDDQLAALAIQGMLPYLKDKLIGHHFDNLGFLTQKVAALSEQR